MPRKGTAISRHCPDTQTQVFMVGGGRGVPALETPKVGEFTPKGVRGAGMSLVAGERKSELSAGDTQTE